LPLPPPLPPSQPQTARAPYTISNNTHFYFFSHMMG